MNIKVILLIPFGLTGLFSQEVDLRIPNNPTIYYETHSNDHSRYLEQDYDLQYSPLAIAISGTEPLVFRIRSESGGNFRIWGGLSISQRIELNILEGDSLGEKFGSSVKTICLGSNSETLYEGTSPIYFNKSNHLVWVPWIPHELLPSSEYEYNEISEIRVIIEFSSSFEKPVLAEISQASALFLDSVPPFNQVPRLETKATAPLDSTDISLQLVDHQQLLLHFSTEVEKSYRVMVSHDLLLWSDSNENVKGDGYRALVTLPLEGDGTWLQVKRD